MVHGYIYIHTYIKLTSNINKVHIYLNISDPSKVPDIVTNLSRQNKIDTEMHKKTYYNVCKKKKEHQ